MVRVLPFLAGAAVVSAARLSANSDFSSSMKPRRVTNSRRATTYTLAEDLSGQAFLDAFNYQPGTNDNGGFARYVDEAEAQSSKLVEVGIDGSVHIRVDSTPKVSGSRASVKLVSQKTCDGGLFIADIERTPQTCGVIEYVSMQTQNSFSVHTGAGCTMGTSGYSGEFMLAGSLATTCDVAATNAQGCGVRSAKTNSVGAGANLAGGGVYALLWDDAGISGWFIARANVTADTTSKDPNPTKWGTPDFKVAASSCDPFATFVSQMLVLNTNLCGTWAKGVWNSDNSYAGQEGSCADITGYSTCTDYVASEGADFSHAHWKINSLRIYN